LGRQQANSRRFIDRSIRDNAGQVELLVAGAVASDTMCDYAPFTDSTTGTSPVLHTSNPSSISQSAGGVGRNVAVAARFAGAQVALATAVADDLAGMALLDQLHAAGVGTDYVRRLHTSNGARTAQYVAVNDTKKDLVMAMADMSILARAELESSDYWENCLESSKPKWIVVDSNWSPAIMSTIFKAAKASNIPTAFEPVSTAKSLRLFDKAAPSIDLSHTIPNHALNLASPNALELTAMYTAAREAGYFDTEQWWQAVDSFGLSSSGSRNRLAATTSNDLVEQGIPQQALQLLPYIPHLVVKLGPQGCLLAQLLKPGDSRLTKPESSPFIIARHLDDDSAIGGVYLRLFPASSYVSESEIVSVNGIGDTMLGVIMASLVKGRPLDEAVPLGQEAAVMSLKSAEAVSPEVRLFQTKLR
jgi:pseudouridylate synthase / pseudouridine kinase